MATYQVIDPYPPFEYGSAVQWLCADMTTSFGSIVGFRIVDTAYKAKKTGMQIGIVLALVEDKSGCVMEIPLENLSLL